MQEAKAAEKAAKKAKAAAKAEASKAAASAPKPTNTKKQALAAEAEEKKVCLSQQCSWQHHEHCLLHMSLSHVLLKACPAQAFQVMAGAPHLQQTASDHGNLQTWEQTAALMMSGLLPAT